MKPFDRAYNFLIIAVQGGGKTTLANQMIKAMQPLRVLVIDPDGMEEKWQKIPEIDLQNVKELETFTGIRKAFYEDGDFHYIYHHFHNGMLIMDDAANYMGDNGKVDENLKRTYRRSRQKRLFILAITHNFGDTPPFLFRFASDYILFYTEDAIETRKRYLPAFNRFQYIKKIIDHISGLDKIQHRYKYGKHIGKQELVSGTYDKWIIENMGKYFPSEIIRLL